MYMILTEYTLSVVFQSMTSDLYIFPRNPLVCLLVSVRLQRQDRRTQGLHKHTNKHTDGRYQMHYLPASLSFAVDNKLGPLQRVFLLLHMAIHHYTTESAPSVLRSRSGSTILSCVAEICPCHTKCKIKRVLLAVAQNWSLHVVHEAHLCKSCCSWDDEADCQIWMCPPLTAKQGDNRIGSVRLFVCALTAEPFDLQS